MKAGVPGYRGKVTPHWRMKMKKLTILISDKNIESLDFSALLDIAARCHSFSIETLPDTEKKARVVHRKGHAAGGLTARDVVLNHYQAGLGFDKTEVMDWLEQAGLSPSSASPTLTKLKRDEKVVVTGTNQYRFA